ncbi:MAG: hypothetical protein ACYC5O_17380 [Anaerolineae bacterium]
MERYYVEVPDELLRRGMRALIDSLGIVDAIRFMQAVHGTSGDYTEERRKWVDSATLEDIMAGLRAQHQVAEEPERYQADDE